MSAATWGANSSLINVNELTEYVRHKALDMMAFSQVCVPPTGEALGKGKGDTVQYTYYQDLSTTGGELDENEEMPEGSVTPIKKTYTLKEYGNSIKWTGKYEDFSRLDVEDSFTKALADDLRRLENSAAYTQFNATYWSVQFRAAGNDFKTNNTPTVTSDADLSLANLRYLVKKAKKNLIPKFDGERYVLITGPESSDALRFDSDVQNRAAYASSDSGKSVLNGEVDSLVEARIVEDTHKIAKIGSTQFDTGYLIGGDCVVNEYALPVELREEVKDFKRQAALAYYFIGAWAKILNQTDHSMEHVIKITSA